MGSPFSFSLVQETRHEAGNDTVMNIQAGGTKHGNFSDAALGG